MSKYILITTSPRKGGNSDSVAEFIKDSLGDNEVEIWNIYEKDFTYCHGDDACKKKGYCVYDDDAKALVDDLKEVDGAFIIAPLYFGRLPGPACTLIDRFYGAFNPSFGVDAPNPDKKLGVVITLGGDEETAKKLKPLVNQTIFSFSVLGFGTGESVILPNNNALDGFSTSEDQQAQVKSLVDWML